MTKDFNYKPYLICVLIISILCCLFSYKNTIGFVLGTLYFFISDRLNQYKYPKMNSKSVAIGKVFLILFIQFLLILCVALSSYYIGGLSAFLLSFTGIVFPHIYFIIAELRKSK